MSITIVSIHEPVTTHHAYRIAAELHDEGLSWSAVSVVMRIYHGIDRRPDTWRNRSREVAARPTNPGYRSGCFRPRRAA